MGWVHIETRKGLVYEWTVGVNFFSLNITRVSMNDDLADGSVWMAGDGRTEHVELSVVVKQPP